MARFILFELLFWTSILYALFRGGAAERAAAIICAIDFAVAPYLLSSAILERYSSTEWPMLVAGGLAFVGFLVIALRSERYWPLWMTAMQGNVVLTHLASSLAPLVNGWTYGSALALWSYLQLSLLGIATWRYRHCRIVDGDMSNWPGFSIWSRLMKVLD